MAEASDAGLPYHVLARKYRPRDFATLVGQDAMVRTLRNAIESGRLAHAFMLTGVRGVGKTTTARIIARALNCVGRDGKSGPTVDPCGVCEHCTAITEDRHVDVIEKDAATHTGVDDVRELIEGVRYRPVSARYKVYIIDEVHMLSNNAFNALLKTLEEPPPHVKFIFATTELRKVPVTVLSRCQRFDLRRVPPDVLQAHFNRIAAQEKVEIAPEAVVLIARAADGSVRDGLSLLDQAIAHGAGVVDAAQVREMLGLADRGRIFDLLQAAFRGKAADSLAVLTDLYDAGADPVIVLQDLLDLVHWLTRLKITPEIAANAPDLERVRGREMIENLSMATLTRAWQMLLKGLQETLAAPSPIHAAEMALIRLCYAAELPAPADLVRQLQGNGAGGGPLRGNGSGDGGGTAVAGRGIGTAPGSGPVASAGGHGSAALARAPQAIDTAPAPRAEASRPEPRPEPKGFADVVALFESRREPVLVHHLVHHVHLVRCEPGRLEFRPVGKAPPNLAARVATLLGEWTGRRWVALVSNDPGEATLAEQRAAHDDARRAKAMEHPMVQAVLAAFPGAQLEAVRRRGEPEESAVPSLPPAPDSFDDGALPGTPDDYPVDEIPEGDL
jgi:DNA polymerase-3 subunit gamma/tau